ncbi:fructoselysine kinase [Paenibacillus albidus]|uniref:PfkB family carbohydrate kinase n=1 Tax=Paenibacillus albidus TaxID=2041023 RepID=UPI001BECF37A|nr:PfkB family carbohydrate kinase [Paenibacillus albidus]MBT2293647.1 fructoselysine kinase [Paenibacillus albidus]
MKLIGIGDNVVDYYQDQGMIYPGGNALNVAVSAKRNGVEVSAYFGIAGDDAAADLILGSLREERVEMRIRRVYGPSGEATVTLNEEGDRIFVGTNRGTRVQSLLMLKFTQEDLDYINGFDLIHTSVNSDLEHELPRLSFKPLSFDFSTPKKWTYEYLAQICPHLTYAFFSGSELTLDEINRLMKVVHGFGVKVVGVTRGSEPALFSESGQRFEQLPVSIDVVDTMGAGDSFIGGFLAAYHQGKGMQASLLQAARSAASTCTVYGAFGYGTRR